MGGPHLLPLALLSHKFGSSPSARLGIVEPAIALDFDQAALLGLRRFENQQQTNERFMAARLNAAMVWGRGSGESVNGGSDGGAAQRRAAEFFG